MKKILLLCMTLYSILAGAQNRVAGLPDLIKYGSYIQAGDVIIDTPTKKYADNINQLAYTSVSKSFPGLREDGTIWIDGAKLGSVCEFRFVNIKETTPWHISSATFKPIPGTFVQGVYTSNSYGGFLYLIQGLKNLVMDGESEAFQGINGLKKGGFLSEQFGFRGTTNGVYQGYHVYSISVLSDGTFTFKGLEGEGGFSVMRFQGGSYDNTVKLVGSNSYFHDSSSELMYIGATHGPPYSKIKSILWNLALSRSGSEALQLQHLVDGSWIHNITIHSATTGYTNEFQPFQDTGIQISADGGNIKIENITLDSWGSHGVNLFGSPYTSDVKNIVIKNIAMTNGRGPAIYPHPSLIYGMKWTIDNLFVWNLNGAYYTNNKAIKPNWIFGSNLGTDSISVNNINYSGSSTLFQNLSKIFISGTAKLGNIPSIEYVNPGFVEPANKIKTYNKYYGKYFSGKDTLRVDYNQGDILIDKEPGFKKAFVKVLNDFTAINTRPRNDKINCVVLTWDNAGVRNDQPGWSATSLQRAYPPDDIRIKYNSQFGALGIGLIEPRPDLDALLLRVAELEKTVTDLTLSIQSKDVMIKDLSDTAATYKQDLDKAKQELNTVVQDIRTRLQSY